VSKSEAGQDYALVAQRPLIFSTAEDDLLGRALGATVDLA
jgi:hypothetical protein